MTHPKGYYDWWWTIGRVRGQVRRALEELGIEETDIEVQVYDFRGGYPSSASPVFNGVSIFYEPLGLTIFSEYFHTAEENIIIAGACLACAMVLGFCPYHQNYGDIGAERIKVAWA